MLVPIEAYERVCDDNASLQRELETEHALAEALGHELEQLKAENAKLLDLLQDTWIAFHSATEDEFADVKSRLVEVGIEVEL
jgi:hypothetical protein